VKGLAITIVGVALGNLAALVDPVSGLILIATFGIVGIAVMWMELS
jgi:hypothetical protein